MNTDRISKRDENKTNFNIVWILYGVQFLFMFLAIFVTNKYYPKSLIIDPFSNGGSYYLLLIIVFVPSIIILLIAWFEHRLSPWFLLIGYFSLVTYLCVTFNLLLRIWAPNGDLLPYLGVMLVPGPLLILMGILGYFKIIDTRKTWVIVTFVAIGVLISFLVLFFAKINLNLITTNPDYQKYLWLAPFVFVILFFVKNIIDFYQIQKLIENGTGVRKEVIQITLYSGISLFFRFSVMLWSWIFKFFKKPKVDIEHWKNEEEEKE